MSGEGWYRRVVPVTTSVVGVVALLALVFPGVRDQVALSATHEEQEYVALSFSRTEQDTVVTCTTAGRRARVGFVVTSAYAGTRTIPYEVVVGDATAAGTVEVGPGETVELVEDLRRPATQAYDVEVRLPDDDRRIHSHCDGAAS